MDAKQVVILGGARTPFGKFGGSLKDLTATDLGIIAAQEALRRSQVAADQIDHVVFGNVLQTSADAIYLARHVGLRAGVPLAVPAVTVNRLCGSGFEAVIEGARQILLGESRVVLAGGTESMSQAPHVIRGARWGLRLNAGKLEDSLWEALTDSYCGYSMAQTAENLAEREGISRQAADEYAYRSQMAAKEAWESGRMAEEIVPVEIPGRKGDKVVFSRDEHMRPETTLEALAKLPPYFKKDGTITAGNASGIVDGAGALVVAHADFAETLGVQPLGRIVSWGISGVEPAVMGIGPVEAIKIALRKADLRLEQIDLIEVNEAFSPQYLAVEKVLGLDRQRTNVNGGAIAIGHPLAATGARLTLTLLLELRRRGGRYGIASACIGGGQGSAVIVEALSG